MLAEGGRAPPVPSAGRTVLAVLRPIPRSTAVAAGHVVVAAGAKACHSGRGGAHLRRCRVALTRAPTPAPATPVPTVAVCQHRLQKNYKVRCSRTGTGRMSARCRCNCCRRRCCPRSARTCCRVRPECLEGNRGLCAGSGLTRHRPQPLPLLSQHFHAAQAHHPSSVDMGSRPTRSTCPTVQALFQARRARTRRAQPTSTLLRYLRSASRRRTAAAENARDGCSPASGAARRQPPPPPPPPPRAAAAGYDSLQTRMRTLSHWTDRQKVGSTATRTMKQQSVPIVPLHRRCMRAATAAALAAPAFLVAATRVRVMVVRRSLAPLTPRLGVAWRRL